MTHYQDFTKRLKLLISKHPDLITTTLSNIFTMRLIGNKTHGDLAEIGIVEFINQFMYDFKATHVGKDLYRAKEHEEDIEIFNEITQRKFPISLKAYGDGPLQLSTDKTAEMFPFLQSLGNEIIGENLEKVWNHSAFVGFSELNVLPLIYNEKKQQCNILVFDALKAKQCTASIKLEESGHGRKHSVFKFYDKEKNYVCEVRYGGATANALQRGLWTHTKNGLSYFESITNGWIDYQHNHTLVQLFSHALVSTQRGHTIALKNLKEDIRQLKQDSKLV